MFEDCNFDWLKQMIEIDALHPLEDAKNLNSLFLLTYWGKILLEFNQKIIVFFLSFMKNFPYISSHKRICNDLNICIFLIYLFLSRESEKNHFINISLFANDSLQYWNKMEYVSHIERKVQKWYKNSKHFLFNWFQNIYTNINRF